MEKFVCKNCGKEFLSCEPSAKFCCRECYIENAHSKVEVRCAVCGKIEYVPLSRAKTYKCCSVECSGKRASKNYRKLVTLTCPICGKKYECKQSKLEHHRTCGDKTCRSKWLSITRSGKNNSNYHDIEIDVRKNTVTTEIHSKSKTTYQHVVKKILGLPSTSTLPKGYVIHHKDANHMNNNPENLVVLPKHVHRLIHTKFGNILIRGIHTGTLSREHFFNICTDEEKKFYEQIIDLNITHQVVLKQGELLETPEEDNQQPSIYRNIIEGSTTNSRVLTDNAEDSNTDTSALPDFIGDDIV